MKIDRRTIQLVDIESITAHSSVNMVDLTVDDDQSFTLSNGMVAHNSAAKAGKSTGDRDTMGFLALRGVPINIQSAENLLRKKKNKDGKEEVSENVEFKNIMIAMGLKIGEPIKSVTQLRYSKLCIMTDADHDGAGHITGLLINNFFRFWPELFTLGVMHRFVTPLVKVWNKGNKNPQAFYDEHEFKAWFDSTENAAKFPMKYYKGLATSTAVEFKEYLDKINDHLIMLNIEDETDSGVIDLVFGKTSGAADRRKEWLNLTE